MTWSSCIAAVTTFTAGIIFLLQPPTPKDGDLWNGISNWLLTSNPTPPYSKLPLFGVQPDILLHPKITVRGDGFHRRYRLDVGIKKETNLELKNCILKGEWQFPKDIIIDQWLLHRQGQANWNLKGSVDLEAPVYSNNAKPFTLLSEILLSEIKKNSVATFEIPDIQFRYQEPSYNSIRSTKIPLQPPNLQLSCPDDNSEFVLKVEHDPKNFGVLEFTVPVIIPSTTINFLTMIVISLSIFYLLYHLYKA